ncbi:MAG TPA: hypothetical protein VNO30_36795 [Kofleriaceae bacterium]|nr:hypothetical protein [Kofleriaceae bacterium]
MAASFYLRQVDGAAQPSLEELVSRIGFRSTHHEQEGGREVLCGHWGVMEDVRAERQALDWHVCLRLFPHLGDLLDRMGDDADRSMPVAEAFRDACEALRPEVALLYTRPDEVEPEYLDAQYPKVLGLDGILLDQSNPVLLYMSSELAAYFPEAYRVGRDALPVTDGLLLFRGTGAHRWW